MSSAPYTTLDAARSPVFSRDGGTVFFLRGSLSQIWAIALGTGHLRAITAHSERVAVMRRAPGDDRLVYGMDTGGDERQQLWLWDGAARPLTDAPGVIHALGDWSPDGTRIGFAANDRDAACFDVQSMVVATGERTRMSEGRGEMTVGPWHADGTRLIATALHAWGDERPMVVGDGPLPRSGPARFAQLRWTDAGLMGLTDQGGAFMGLRLMDGTAVYAPDCDVDEWALSPDHTLLATVETRAGRSVLNVSGFPSSPGDTCVLQDITWSPDGHRLVMTRSSPTEPSALWLWESGALRPLWQPDCPVPTVPFDPVHYPSFDQQRIPAWIARPTSIAPAAGHPALICMGGGLGSQQRAAFRADMQALLAQGIAVLLPEIRGSSGYGRAFRTAADLDCRLDAVRDVAHAARWLATQPGIDPARIAVMGGALALSAITEHPDLWRCAIDLQGIADFGTFLATTGPWRRAQCAAAYGDPIRHRALFDRISPLRHVDRIVAPLLVLHGARDPRVPIDQSEQLVAAMGDRARPVAYEVFDHAGHHIVRPSDRIRAFRAIETFLRRTL